MWLNKTRSRSPGFGSTALLTFLALAVIAIIASPSTALAQSTSSGPTPSSIWDFFGDGYGDAYSSVFLNQMFGPLFPSASGSVNTSLFAQIIAYFNVIVLLVGGMMFFYNVTIGVMQSAHEGQVLGQRWSSLWAPLRVVFAVGMLVPVNHGYNLAQTGVAYVVQGSTKMASAVWGATADAVLDKDIPIAAPTIRVAPEVVSALYEQAACMTALEAQVKNANSNSSVVYVPVSSGVNDGLRYHYTTAINNGSQNVDFGVCGSWSTPPVPGYLDKIIKGISENAVENANMTDSKASEITKAFRDGHRDIMLDISREMREITNDNYAQISASDIPPASIAGKLSTTMTTANADLGKLIADIKSITTSDDLGVNRARDSLLRRINGSNACFSDNGSHTVTGPSVSGTPGEVETARNRAASVSCYGEGWMGAGSWYILMAKVNNELSSLNNAQSSTVKPSYSTDTVKIKDLFNSAGGDSTGWFWTVSARDVAGMPSVAQALDAMKKYQALYESSSIELAALGVSLPTNILNKVNEEVGESSFWEKIISRETMARGTEAMLSMFDPSKQTAGGDPMVGIISLGHFLINMGSAIISTVVVVGWVFGSAAAIAALPIFSVLLSAGVSLSFILPIMPFLYWVLGISGYFLLITEAVIAVNLWALSHLRMDGEGFSGEAGRQGWLMLLALFMTPTLMVFGFIIGMLIFRIVSDLISAGLFYAVSGIATASPIVWLFGTIGYTVLIVTAYGLLLERSFSLVSEFPNRVMRWMGSSVEIGGGEGRIQAAGAAAAIGVNHAGNAIEKSIGQRDPNNRGKIQKGVGIAGIGRSWAEKAMTKKGVTKGGP